MKNSHVNHVALTSEELSKMEFRKNLKDKLSNDPTVSVQQLFQREQSKVVVLVGDLEVADRHIPQLYSIQSGLYKHRLKSIPEIPKSIEDIKLEGKWSMTEDSKRFLLYQSSEMIIFCSDAGLSLLAESKRWQSDGTFSITPTGFNQLYIIYAFYKWQMISCAYVLLTGKTEELYKKMILQLKEGALNIQKELKPEFIMIDFELAVKNAYRRHFPTCSIRKFKVKKQIQCYIIYAQEMIHY